MQSKGTNLFSQIIALIERDAFRRLVRRFGNDKHSVRMSCAVSKSGTRSAKPSMCS